MKKVRGRGGVGNIGSESTGKSSRSISMALLLTLPLDTTPTVSPLPLLPHSDHETQSNKAEEEQISTEADSISGISKEEEGDERPMFRSFGFEDYAWRVYHERLLLKDPLYRYRI